MCRQMFTHLKLLKWFTIFDYVQIILKCIYFFYYFYFCNNETSGITIRCTFLNNNHTFLCNNYVYSMVIMNAYEKKCQWLHFGDIVIVIK